MKRRIISMLLVATVTSSLMVGCGSSEQTQEEAAQETGAETTESDSEADADNAAEEVSEAAEVVADTTETTESAGNEEAVENLIAATEGTVDLTLWCSETEAYQTVMAELVEDFKAQYPDIDFNITIGAESEANCKDDVLVDVEAAADLFVFPDDQLVDLVNAGALQSIDATFTYDPKTANAEATVDAASIDGTLYAYPLTASNGYFLFYNKDYLTEEDVTSWDSLLAAAAEQGKTVGMEVSGAWFLYGFFAGAGLDMYLDDATGKNVCNWNATDTQYTGADVATAITEICKNEAMVNCVNEDAQAFALNGEMIADVNGTWATNAFMEAYGEGYAAVKLPTFTVNGDQVQMGSFAGYKFIGVNAYSQNPGWAMLLGEFLSNEDSQTKIAVATGEGPSNTVSASSEEIASAPALAALAEQSEYADLQRVGDNYWSPAATLGESIVEGNYTDAQTLLDDAVAGITQ